MGKRGDTIKAVNIIFLDIDGVLNNASFQYGTLVDLRIKGDIFRILDPICVRNFNSITSQIDVKIVISSSWRVLTPYQEVAEIFERQGVLNAKEMIFDQTPKTITGKRGEDIQRWLDKNKIDDKVDANIVIIDDADDMLHLSDHLVQTTWDKGLEEKHVTQVLKKFEELQNRKER